MLWKLRRSSTTGIIHLSWLIGFWTLSFMSYSHNQMFGIWRPQDCVEELKRLEYHHPGFSSGRDPVFNGDKFDYLSAASSQYCNPSFKIPLNMGSTFLDEALECAKLFLDDFKA